MFIIRFISAWLFALAISSSVRADEDRAAALAEEAVKTADESSLEQPLVPQAENVDLKEVIAEPLQQALPLPVELEDTGSSGSSGSSGNSSGKPEEPTAAVDPAKVAEATEVSSTALFLLGTEVLPGTATRLAWSAKDTLAGISVPTPVLIVHGVKPGPIVCLTGAVHGDELNGIEVVRQVLYDLQPDKLHGSVIGVPIVNLQGFRRASRYLSDRRDLNRYFPGHPSGSSAARIAHSFFTQVIQHCNYLIDLHTGSFRRTNLPQLRADLHNPKVAEMTQNLGPIVVLQSRGARGSLRREALEAGVVAVTIEAGEPLHVDLEAVTMGVRSVENFLHKLNMYQRKGLWARKTEPIYYKSRWVRSGSGGILLSNILLGERVRRGQTLGVVTDPITNVATSIDSPIDGQVIGMALNQVMLPGFAAYHIGFQATVEEAASQDVGPDDSAGDDAKLDESEEPASDLPPP